MLIAPEFVFVHAQKTGGSFVSDVIRNLLCPDQRLHIFYKLDRKYGIRLPLFPYRYRELRVNRRGQHAWCNDIPAADRTKPIVSIIRNPFDFYVSAYTFGWWKRDLDHGIRKGSDGFFRDVDEIKRKHPDYAKWDFPQFLATTWESSLWVTRTLASHPNARNLGMLSHRFVYFYCTDHDYVFEAAHDPGRFVARVKENLHDVHFLRQDRLNQDLHDFLLSVGYPAEKVAFIAEKGRVNASKRKDDFREYYDKRLEQQVREKDALIFELFPDFEKELRVCGEP